jgi:ubiquinone/menaquinone biosynthesis C-methylase UbiE
MRSDLRFQLSESAAQRYDALSLPLMHRPPRPPAERVRPGDTVLDLACGTAYTARAALDRAGARSPGAPPGVTSRRRRTP